MNKSEILILGGNDGQKYFNDYIVFDHDKQRVVERKEIAGSYEDLKTDKSFGLKEDQESFLFLSIVNGGSFDLCKLKRSSGQVKKLYEIDYHQI